MHVRQKGAWLGGYLDAFCPEDGWRVEVQGWVHVPGQDTWAGPARTLRTAAHYVKRVGLEATARKILSRKAAPLRTHRAIGFGRVMQAPEGATLDEGALVGFGAIGSAQGQSHVVVQAPWVVALSAPPVDLRSGQVCWVEDPSIAPLVAGLHPTESGRPSSCDEASLARALARAPWHQGERVEVPPHAPHTARGALGNGRVVMMGHGHYAKTCILPHLGALGVRAVHDLDPLRLPVQPDRAAHRWSTSPMLEDGELRGAQDVAWVAGYHHHHAPLACQALEQGSWAVIEKPAVTTPEALRALAQAMDRNPRVLMGFHKRHSALHEWMVEDLELGPETPAHYHCIVHEVPLPSEHWYRWPASRSRLISNGCHWLDEFLWLNPTHEVEQAHVRQASGVLHVWVTLTNGATFTMTLSDHGSSRLGVREFVEVRAGARTARVEDASRIQTEDASRVLRSARVNPMDAYPRMVGALSAIIQRDDVARAEPREHFVRLNTLLLQLDASLQG